MNHRSLVLDLYIRDTWYYAPSPLVVGIFEFSMMRTGPGLDQAKWARLFHEYMEQGPFWAANFDAGQQVSIMRAVPHEGTVALEPHVEILDYEKATAIVESSDRFSLGLCSCRHEHQHLGDKTCKAPLHPENTFEKLMLACLERGTLQNQLFDDPTSKRQAFLRAVVGGFLRLPPVKQALMSDSLRSRFLAGIRSGAGRQGKQDLTTV